MKIIENPKAAFPNLLRDLAVDAAGIDTKSRVWQRRSTDYVVFDPQCSSPYFVAFTAADMGLPVKRVSIEVVVTPL
jgi:hypothetical protein